MSDDQGALFHRNLTEYRDAWEATVSDVNNEPRCPECGCYGAHFCTGKPIPILPTPTEPNPATPAEAEGTDFIEEGNKKQSAQRAILRALISGPRTNKELMEIGGHRFSARLHELRAAGYDIETERTGRVFTYRLVRG